MLAGPLHPVQPWWSESSLQLLITNDMCLLEAGPVVAAAAVKQNNVKVEIGVEEMVRAQNVG